MPTVLPDDLGADAVLSWWVAISITAATFAVASVIIGEPIQTAVSKRDA